VKIIFLTEGSKKVGFGHITRCLSIYQAFEDMGFEPEFIVNGDNSVKQILNGTNYKIFNWLEEKNKLFDYLKKTNILFIDSYLAELSLYLELNETAELCVYIDDNRRLDYPKGIILNANIHAEKLYKSKDGKHFYLLGTRYVLLRKEFWYMSEKKIRQDIKKIMVTFGGDDFKNMTPKVLKFFTENYTDLIKFVIAGGAFKNIDEIKEYSDDKTEIIYSADALAMKNIMLDSDIVISAAGQTLYEICATKTPAISITVAENQKGNASGFDEVGVIPNMDYNDDKLTDKLRLIFEELKEYSLRNNISLKMSDLVNNNGAISARNEILKIFSGL